MSRSLNKVTLIGNLTRDPELRYTPQGHAVAVLSLATNREWTKNEGDKVTQTEYHTVVAWNKLAELCSQLLKKGTKVYVEGRLQSRKWVNKEGKDMRTTEVVAEDMIVLSGKRDDAPENSDYSKEEGSSSAPDTLDEDVFADEIPF